MGKNLVWADRGRLSVVVHNSRAPTNLEWSAYLNHVRARKDLKNQRVLVATDGGSPDGRQRRDLEEVVRTYHADPAPMAVLTSSLIVRAVMKVAAFFNPAIRCYTPDEFSAAVTFLELSPAEREFASTQLVALRQEVALEQAAS